MEIVCRYGSGIYVSPAAAVSNAYSVMSVTKVKKDRTAHDEFVEDGIDIGTFRCIAICEVINKDLKMEKDDIWIQPHEEYVAVRFLCVYHFGCGQGAKVRLDDEANVASLMKINT